jgi:hypothetical protein
MAKARAATTAREAPPAKVAAAACDHRFGRPLYAGSGGTPQRRCLICGGTSRLLRYEGYSAVWGPVL